MVIPLYKLELSSLEWASFASVTAVLGQHPLAILAPQRFAPVLNDWLAARLDLTSLNLQLHLVDDRWLADVPAYNHLLLTPWFYDHGLGAECAVRTRAHLADPAACPSSELSCGTITMQEIIASHGPVDLLKIDIEGAEAHLFSPRQDLRWLRDVSAIVIELHDRYEPGCSRHFWAAVRDFPVEACRGENLYVSRLLG